MPATTDWLLVSQHRGKDQTIDDCSWGKDNIGQQVMFGKDKRQAEISKHTSP